MTSSKSFDTFRPFGHSRDTRYTESGKGEDSDGSGKED